jgi:hypothetical protein
MEYGMYAKISSNELIMIAKEERNVRGRIPVARNLQRYSMFNRKLSKATKYIILNTDSVAKRREVLLHLIRVVEVRQTVFPRIYRSKMLTRVGRNVERCTITLQCISSWLGSHHIV